MGEGKDEEESGTAARSLKQMKGWVADRADDV